ncbi:neprilysin-1-like [Ornithodoros turicata]|uniref:neprilysin-1-like n=1 Tax=Ornithodoros turicata TaxID=34597 RepID=UPI0031392C0F
MAETDHNQSPVPETTNRGPRLSKGIIVAAVSVFVVLLIAVGVAFAVKNLHRPRFHGEFQAAHLFSWQRQRSGFIYTCTSEHCLKEGEQLQKHVAWTLDPCDDFYDYVCSSTKPASSVRKSAVQHFLREVHHVIRKFEKLGWLRRTRLTKMVTAFYRACKFSERSEASMQEQIEQALGLLKISGPGSSTEEGLAMLAKVLQVFPFVHVSVSTKARSQKECIVLRRPQSFDGDNIFYIPHVFSKAYFEFVRRLVGTEDAARNVKEIESSLKRYQGLRSEGFQKLSEYEPTTAGELKSDVIDWNKFLSGLVESLASDSCVVIRSPDYFSHLGKVLNKFKIEQLNDYLKYKAILHLLPFVKLAEAGSSAPENFTEDVCSLTTYRLYNYIFVHHFNSTVRLDVITSAGMKEAIVRNSYRSVLDSAVEVPTSTVNTIEDEIMSIAPNYFSLMDNVDAYYTVNAPELNSKQILLSYVKTKLAQASNYVKVILKSGDTIHDTNLELRCHFDPDTTILTVPLSIAPLVLKGREFFLESSTVGFVMTRFLYHVFQEKLMFNSEADSESLQNIKSCLEHQYSSIEVPSLNKTLDGQRTLRENVADNVAVNVLHRAYRTSLLFYITTMDALGFQNVFLHFQNLPSVSSEQLFYLMFGQSFCDPDEDTNKVVDEAPWVPAKYRVNVPLSNYEPFAKAFECQQGTRMNPKKKCHAF